jgi:putative PIN family toxin of toxin-antitoxin system
VIRAVLDANVVVAALLSPRGTPAKVVALAGAEYELVWSPAIVAECLRVIAYPKLRPRLKVARPGQLIAQLAEAATMVETELPELGAIPDDPSDEVYLATALVGAARRVVSGDRRHLLKLREFAGVKVVTPAEFLAELSGG